MLYITLLDGSKNGNTHDLVSVKAAMNLKKLARWKWKASLRSLFSLLFSPLYAESPVAA